MTTITELEQGVREHRGQFSLHVLLVFATGLTIGSERTVVPVLREHVLGVESFPVIGVVVLPFLVSIFLIKEPVQYAQAEGDDDDHDPVQ